MATSGYCTTTSSHGRSVRLSWEQDSQSISGNYTRLYWTLKGAGGSGWVMSGNFKAVINGKTVYSSSKRIKLYAGTTIASGYLTIYHERDGRQDFSASVQAGIYAFAVNCHGSGSWSLNHIDRMAMITSAPDFSDTDSTYTIKYDNPAGTVASSVEVALAEDTPDAPTILGYVQASRTGSSYTFKLTDEVKDKLYKLSPHSSRLSLRVYARTQINGITLKDWRRASFRIKAAYPVIKDFRYWDDNTISTQVTKDNQKIIQGVSRLQFYAAGTAFKGASLKKLEFTFGDESKTFHGSEANYNFGTTNKTSKTPAKLRITDSRGLTTYREIDVTVLSWERPSGTLEARRKEGYYDETITRIEASISSVSNLNALEIYYRTKKAGGTFGGWRPAPSGEDFIIPLDNKYEWIVQARIRDRFSHIDIERSVPKGVPILFADRMRNSVGINCFPAENNSFEVNGLDLSNLIHVASSKIGDDDYMTLCKTWTQLGAYSNFLIRDVTSGIKVPPGYEYIYRLTAQVSTTDDNLASVGINNIWTNPAGTWSGTKRTFRVFTSSDYFRESDIELEDTHNFSRRKGMNLKLRNSQGDGEHKAYFYNITLHVYLSKMIK